MYDLTNIQKELSQIMEGLNFATEFEIINLEYCYSENELWANFKKNFQDEKSYSSILIDYDVEEFWSKLNYAFEYRGDGYSGFKVDGETEERLLSLQYQYKNELSTLFNKSRYFKHYPNFQGLNYYPVFWGFNILFETKNNWFMVIGNASD